jgi:hypothetical protein
MRFIPLKPLLNTDSSGRDQNAIDGDHEIELSAQKEDCKAEDEIAVAKETVGRPSLPEEQHDQAGQPEWQGSQIVGENLMPEKLQDR